MEPGGDASGWLDDLKRQFNGMDVADDAGAVTAMRGAAALLRKRELSFRLLVQRIETQHLLVPLKISAAIQMMDSDLLQESESALLGARRMMRSCGLTFGQIITALQVRRPSAYELERLRQALVLKSQRVQVLEGEVERLQQERAPSKFDLARVPGELIALSSFAVCCIGLAAFAAWTFAQAFQPNWAHAQSMASSVDAAVVSPLGVQPTISSIGKAEPSHNSPRGKQRECWRDRSIEGRCF
jgi:hypothetical protein